MLPSAAAVAAAVYIVNRCSRQGCAAIRLSSISPWQHRAAQGAALPCTQRHVQGLRPAHRGCGDGVEGRAGAGRTAATGKSCCPLVLLWAVKEGFVIMLGEVQSSLGGCGDGVEGRGSA